MSFAETFEWTLSIRDVDSVISLYLPHAVLSEPGARVTGLDAVRRHYEHLFSRFPRLRRDLVTVVEEGPLVAYEWLMEVNDERVEGASVIELRDGLITKHAEYWTLPKALLE